MFSRSAFTKAGLFYLLVLTIAIGPLVHAHPPASNHAGEYIHHTGHTHDADGNILEIDEQQSDWLTGAATGHFHLPPVLDHMHDTWMFKAALAAPQLNIPAFRPLGEERVLRAGTAYNIDKPPRKALKA